MNTALITGAGRGIGLATARAFLAAGWKVLGLDKDFSKCDEKAFERIDFDLRNLAGIRKLVEEREIHTLVNVGSVAAFTGHPDLWYGISKAGILNLTKAWAKELGPHGVLVNAVAPGPTQTAMYDQLPQSRKDGVMRSVHSGRVGTPAEIAAAILWLGSACPQYVNGTTLDVNDGSYPR